MTEKDGRSPDARPADADARPADYLPFERLTATRYRDLLAEMDRHVELEDALDCARIEADTDPLTGLLNRRGLERRTAARDWGWFVAIDLDGFKSAQDHHPDGHSYGDGILRELAAFLRDSIRSGDVLASRKGGDEFLVWVETRAGARRIRDAVRAWRSADGKVGASAGLGRTPDAADAACYLDKKEKDREG